MFLSPYLRRLDMSLVRSGEALPGRFSHWLSFMQLRLLYPPPVEMDRFILSDGGSP